MLRNPIPLIFLALVIWVLGGTYLHHNASCCGAFSGPPLSINDGNAGIANSANNLLFGFSGAAPDFSSGNVKSEFSKLATYLKSNPAKAVTLTGLYAKEEENKSEFDNLGLGRADAMKQYLIGLGVPAAQLLTGSALRNNLAFHEKQLYGGIDYSFSTLASPNHLAIKDAAAFEAGTDDNFVFARSGYEYKKPISDRLRAELSKTAEYLKSHPDRSLTITGHYHDKEKNNSALPNLGLGRANNIKGLLTGMGVTATQIKIDAEMKTALVFTKEELIGAADYSFFDTPKASGDRLAEVERKLRANPLVINFGTNQETVNLSATQKQYFADLMYYLEHKKGGKVETSGHTDSRGEAQLNDRLSRKRAEFVRDYLVKNGINSTKVQPVGKGSSIPLATNDTPEGRAQNRRAEVSIK